MRLLMALLVGLATAAQAETRLSDDVRLTHGTFSTGGGLTIAAELRRTTQAGTALCGAWAESETLASYTKGEPRRILRLASVSVDGQRIALDLAALPQIAPRLDYAGAPAGCVLTGLPWRTGRVPEISLPRQQVRRAHGGKGTPNIVFRPDGPGAMGAALDPVAILRRNLHIISLSPGATLAEARYSSGGGLRVAAQMTAIDGRAYLCGLWSDLPGQDARTASLGRAVLSQSRAMLGGRVIRQDLGDLRKAWLREEYTGIDATCLETGLDWRAGDAGRPLRIDLPDQVVYRSTTSEGRQVIRLVPVAPGG